MFDALSVTLGAECHVVACKFGALLPDLVIRDPADAVRTGLGQKVILSLSKCPVKPGRYISNILAAARLTGYRPRRTVAGGEVALMFRKLLVACAALSAGCFGGSFLNRNNDGLA
jgi:hypothetical protein